MQQIFKVKFNHIISPDIIIFIENNNETPKENNISTLSIIKDTETKLNSSNKIIIQGQVKIDIEKMLGNFVLGLGLKNMLDKLVEKKTNEEGYFLNIKGIANAKLSLKGSKLHVKAEYLPAKEWWAKPVALVVLGRFLDDFASNIDNSGIKPGFRKNVKYAMQELRKSNSAILELKDLFDKQSFFHKGEEIYIKNFKFNEIKTSSQNGIFIINFYGTAIK